ncbi:hypothetical protein BT69DRAFT_1275535 [Atractiella rhizophila]|nr:hypothetical protein BT69DRAFT_1275535 [Atractiella rhizophila]
MLHATNERQYQFFSLSHQRKSTTRNSANSIPDSKSKLKSSLSLSTISVPLKDLLSFNNFLKVKPDAERACLIQWLSSALLSNIPTAKNVLFETEANKVMLNREMEIGRKNEADKSHASRSSVLPKALSSSDERQNRRPGSKPHNSQSRNLDAEVADTSISLPRPTHAKGRDTSTK